VKTRTYLIACGAILALAAPATQAAAKNGLYVHKAKVTVHTVRKTTKSSPAKKRSVIGQPQVVTTICNPATMPVSPLPAVVANAAPSDESQTAETPVAANSENGADGS